VLAFIAVALLCCGCFALAQTETSPPKGCTVPARELDVMKAFLKGWVADAIPTVVVTFTESSGVDVDSVNLQLAVRGQGVPTAVRQDFKKKATSDCRIPPSLAIKGVRFISRDEHGQIFRNSRRGWAEFHKRYGKSARLVTLSRVGLSPDRTLALLYVTSGIDTRAGSGYVYVFQRNEGRWVKKSEIAAWFT
jgi:hypothetical protein